MLAWLNRLFASALTILLFMLVVAFAASQTFLNAAFMKQELQHQHAYGRLSTALSDDITSKSGSGGDPQVTEQLKRIISPPKLQQRLDSTIDQIQAFYQHNGPVPTLNVSDLLDQAQTAGLPVPDSPELQKPIKLTALDKTRELAKVLQFVGIGLAVVTVLLIIGMFAIARRRRDYKPFAAVLIALGIMLGVTGGVLLLVPRLFNKLVGFNPADNPYGPLARDMALDIVHDFALRLLIPGIAVLVAGILLRILIGKVRKRKAAPDSRGADTPAAPAAPAPAAPITAAPTDAPEDTPAAAPPVPRPSRPPRPPRKIQG
jgi:hypothetical protein